MTVYICKCLFTFERSSQVDACPDCGGHCVREADADEVAEYRRIKAELKEPPPKEPVSKEE